MFEIGFWELVLIGVVALVVIGPERLPGVARTVGRWVGRARQIVSTVRSEVERELQIEEMKRTIAEHDTAEQFRQLHDQIRTLESELRSSVQSADPRTAATPEPLAPPVETAAPLPAASSPPTAPAATPASPAPAAAAHRD
ncbi:Sec-independent protein translocase protein TatB [Plasticicumulans sp.]|uniref:Sec-independent protein translocase protein TatB n=1 Tax=Plasticicumulans sp. TaxID=2307179 RepID=UPI002C8B96A0|nr:Sec-independent protein translocase protein TatB [Plasticicumulans sp.]HNF66389.1 Sec-independent protein translocase protein TatB [Plasticicumulans sp.]HNG48381.1 Sec-independent protein translocase protein TatB [Plasticicumulans sp.]